MEVSTVPVAEDELFRIRIKCRCGLEQKAEVPKLLAKMLNIHVCKDCKRVFGLQLQPEGNWKIKGMDLDVAGIAISPKMIRMLLDALLERALAAEKADAKNSSDSEPAGWTN